MQLQLNYTCDICEDKFLLDFKKSMEEHKIQCPHCNVVYEFSDEDLEKFNSCFEDFKSKIQESKKEQIS